MSVSVLFEVQRFIVRETDRTELGMKKFCLLRCGVYTYFCRS
ncbi:protein of unknown function [Xenorhabdus poinarii G6]|uniref:Uncharacterized protein n=1 Tax=Xenorhabdus poinarii G6 TaxID=1354304 RepID=A0A068R1K0_9GAMM|nr:protein of unknown function [Xenorhabdus poinarii G6]